MNRRYSGGIPQRQWAYWAGLAGVGAGVVNPPQGGVGAPPAVGVFGVDADSFEITSPNTITPDYYPVHSSDTDLVEMSSDGTNKLTFTAVTADEFTFNDPLA